MRNRFCIVMMFAAVTSLAAHSQKANLSGTWKLSVAKSFMGSDHPFPEYQLTRKIEQKSDTVSITDNSVHNSVVNIPLPDSTTRMEVVPDGKEHELELPAPFPGRPPAKAQVTASWQGATLELRQITSGLANYAKHQLFLSDDGSQLIDLVEQHSIFGDSEQRLVFDKAP